MYWFLYSKLFLCFLFNSLNKKYAPRKAFVFFVIYICCGIPHNTAKPLEPNSTLTLTYVGTETFCGKCLSYLLIGICL